MNLYWQRCEILRLTTVVFCFRELPVIGLPEAKLWREYPVRVSSNSVIVPTAYPQYTVGLCRYAHVADSVLWSRPFELSGRLHRHQEQNTSQHVQYLGRCCLGLVSVTRITLHWLLSACICAEDTAASSQHSFSHSLRDDLAKDELWRVLKEWAVAHSRYYGAIRLASLKENTTNLVRCSRFLGQDWDKAPSGSSRWALVIDHDRVVFEHPSDYWSSLPRFFFKYFSQWESWTSN